MWHLWGEDGNIQGGGFKEIGKKVTLFFVGSQSKAVVISQFDGVDNREFRENSKVGPHGGCQLSFLGHGMPLKSVCS